MRMPFLRHAGKRHGMPSQPPVLFLTPALRGKRKVLFSSPLYPRERVQIMGKGPPGHAPFPVLREKAYRFALRCAARRPTRRRGKTSTST